MGVGDDLHRVAAREDAAALFANQRCKPGLLSGQLQVAQLVLFDIGEFGGQITGCGDFALTASADGVDAE